MVILLGRFDALRYSCPKRPPDKASRRSSGQVSQLEGALAR